MRQCYETLLARDPLIPIFQDLDAFQRKGADYDADAREDHPSSIIGAIQLPFTSFSLPSSS
jgi:hypothetical protein